MTGISPVPTSDTNVCRYAAFLAKRLTFSSIEQYLNIIRLLHLECGYDNPLSSSSLRTVLQGIKRVNGHVVRHKEPITPSILLLIRRQLNLSTVYDSAFWAACLTVLWLVSEI